MNKSHSDKFEDKYRELEAELNTELENFAVHPSELNESKKIELLAFKEEIRSGKKYSKIKRKDFMYKLKISFWNFMMRLFYRL